MSGHSCTRDSSTIDSLIFFREVEDVDANESTDTIEDVKEITS